MPTISWGVILGFQSLIPNLYIILFSDLYLSMAFVVSDSMASQSGNMADEPLLFKGQEFKTFAEFEVQLWKYSCKHSVMFTVGSSKRTEQMNKVYAAQGSARRLPNELRYAYAYYRCKRGGPVRTGTGTGKRCLQSWVFTRRSMYSGDAKPSCHYLWQITPPHTSFLIRTWKLGCPSFINLFAKNNVLTISDLNLEHSQHPCDASEFQLYPGVRTKNLKAATSGDDALDVELLLKTKVKPCVIRKLLRDRGSGHISARDLSNIRYVRQLHSK